MSVPVRRFIVLSSLFVFSSLALLYFTGCGECRHDADCASGSLCKAGQCEQTQKPPPRRRGECITDEQRSCYTGAEGTAGRGLCKKGSQICVDGAWGTCEGEVTPADKELCDGKDNNCDGNVDENCDCKDGDTQSCYTGSDATRKKGNCNDGVQSCADGIWGTCLNQKLPQAEVCDNQDNDCNGLVDDGVTKKCQNKCGIGEEVCRAGKFEPCNAPKPSTEVCGDNKDNDCDGTVDEDCECTPNKVRSCYSGPKGTDGNGPCKKGAQSCSSAGKWLDCKGQEIPKVETCNNRDDDCNGSVDDKLKRPCSRGCNSGQEFCQKGKWLGCDAVPADPEVCDGKDNDCNGKIDDLGQGQKCQCRIGQSETCYNGPQGTLGKGLCVSGKRTCQSTGTWSICLKQVVPSVEICDKKDNDCDGRVDNQKGTSAQLKRPCYSGTQGTQGKGICKAGTQTCSNGSWRFCTGEVRPRTEYCNNKDDDCDGKIDENITLTCYSGSFSTRNKGVCKSGKKTCTQGTWGVCAGEKTPSPEQCNNKDDDCDGKTDEGGVCDVCTTGQTQKCYTGPSATRGVSPCKDGTSRCLNGQWGACQNESKPKTETCNNQDDDCNGVIDNGVTRACSTSCGTGTEICQAGTFVQCNAPTPKTEICNNKDDDCNGQVDDGIQCSLLATGDWSGNIYIWNPYTQKKLRTHKATDRVYSIQYSPNKQTLAVGSVGRIHLWHAETGTAQGSLSLSGRLRGLAFSPDSTKIAAGSDNKQVAIWQLSTSSKLKTLTIPATVRALAYFPNGNTLAVASGTTVTFWNPNTGTQLSTAFIGFTIYSIAINKTGTSMLVAGAGSNSKAKVELWDLRTAPYKVKSTFNPSACSILAYHTSFSPDGTRATATCPGAAYVWNVSNQQKLTEIKKSNAYFYSAGLTPDNKYFAVGGRTTGSTGHLYIYDVSTSTPVQKLFDSSHTNYLWSLAFRP